MQRIIKLALFSLLLLLCLSGNINSAFALLLGFAFTFFCGKHFEKFTQTSIHYLLKLSIIGLGFGMYIDQAWKIGKEGFSITLITLSITLGLGLFLTKALKLDSKLGYLIASGTSICGGSAIAAISSVIKAKPQVISVALSVVFFLNALALLFFPMLGHYFHLTQHEFGLWAAIAIHDTSSVVGASLAYGQEALEVATTTKLARTLWIIPISFLSMFLFKSKDGKIKIPWFILLFIGAILLNSYFDLPLEWTTNITLLSKRMLIATLFLVGSTLSIQDIKQSGSKPFILAISLWIVISVLSLLLIIHQ